MDQVRQGDVFLVRSAMPKKIKPVERDNGRVVLAYGEVTGHAHVLTAPEAELFTAEDNRRFLRIMDGAYPTLTHEEHGTIALEPGTYEVRIQREWTDQDEPRAVLD